MLVIPAIDLLDGHIVRLKKGIMERATVYDKTPLEAAKFFADAGAKRIHIVDLNAAKTGENVNFSHIESIAKSVDIEIEAGGGVRDMERLERFFNIGVSYPVLGTAVIKNPEFTSSALEKYPNKIILGIDVQNGIVATDGWYNTTEATISDIFKKYADLKAESIIITDIDRDGMLKGVNIALISGTARISPFPVIASGGVSSIDDIKAIAKINNPNIKGCITGKAVYEGKVDLKDAFSI